MGVPRPGVGRGWPWVGQGLRAGFPKLLAPLFRGGETERQGPWLSSATVPQLVQPLSQAGQAVSIAGPYQTVPAGKRSSPPPAGGGRVQEGDVSCPRPCGEAVAGLGVEPQLPASPAGV